MEYVMKLTMIRVDEGPKLLNRDVPICGRIRFSVMAGMKVRKIPKKQYLIWVRCSPTDRRYD
jgi:hypothetical protein